MRGRAVRLLPVAGMAAFGCVIGAASSASAAPPPVQATPVDGPSVPLSLPNVRALWGVLSVPGVLPTRVNPPSLPGRPGEVAPCVPVPGIGQFGPTEPPNPPSLPGRPGEVATCVPVPGIGQFGPTEPPNPPSLPGRPGKVATCVPVPGIGQLWPPVLLDQPSVHGGGILTCVAVTGGGNLCMSRLHRRRIATWVPTPQVGKLRRRGLPGGTTTTTTPPATTLVGGGANNGGNGGGGNHNGSSGTGSTGGASAGSGASPSGASAVGGSLAHTGFDPMPFLAGGPAALIAGTAVCVQGPRRSCAEPD